MTIRRVALLGMLVTVFTTRPNWADEPQGPHLLLVVGASGISTYESPFRAWASRWQAYAEQAHADCVAIGLDASSDSSDRDRLRDAIQGLDAESSTPVILAMIGHGTHFRGVSKFNLRGPDVTDTELSEWLSRLNRPVAVLQCSSSSAPFLTALARPGRVVVTATRSQSEQNYSRFGDYFSAALSEPAADLDHDFSVSLLEAFLFASRGVEEFYEDQSRLATEHALLDDNGDGRGTSAEFFHGIRAEFEAGDDTPVDGFLAHQFILAQLPGRNPLPSESLARRDELERAIENLRQQKAELTEDVYFERLEPLMLALARLYASAEATAGETNR